MSYQSKLTPPSWGKSWEASKPSHRDGVFEIDRNRVMNGAVFLVDDFVDSRWTFTVIAALLRRAGSGQVFPVALALNSFEYLLRQ